MPGHRAVRRQLDGFDPTAARAHLEHTGCDAVCRHSPQYPTLLAELHDPPNPLYVRGGVDPPEPDGRVVAIGEVDPEGFGRVLRGFTA